MKRLNIWLDKLESKFKLILDKPISMNMLLGFVLGATLPTYALLASNKIKLGDVGEWVGAIATFFAVWVSLYLANKNSKAKLDIKSSTHDFSRMEEYPAFDIINLGSVSASVRVEVNVTKDFVDKMLNNLGEKAYPFEFYNKFKDVIDLAVLDMNGDFIKPYNRLEVGQHNSVSIRIDSSKVAGWINENSPVSGEYDIDIIVEDIDGTKLKMTVNSATFIYVDGGIGPSTSMFRK